MMSRRIAARYLVSVLFLLGVALPMTGVARAGMTSNALPAAVADASAASVGVPRVGFAEARPHFGFSQASVLAQATNVPSRLADLQRLTTITVPGWNAGNLPSFDIQAFDWVRSINYIAARNPAGPTIGNSGPGLLAINTATDTLLGTLSVPDCNGVNVRRTPPSQGSFGCPSGVEVMNDLRKVAVTSRGNAGDNWVEIFDIGADPINAPLLAKIVLPNNQLQPDELTYDPKNHRLYVANTGGSFFVAVIDAVTDTLLGQIPVGQFCPTTMEQPRFDPVDHMIYQNCSDDRVLLRINPDLGSIGQIVSAWRTPSPENGIDIDPLNNQALLGSSPGPQVVVDLNAPNTLTTPLPPIPVVASFPQVLATDGLYFDNNTLRWYTGSSGNTNAGSPPGTPCPPSPLNPVQFPVLGVFQGTSGPDGTPSFVGVECTGNGAHTVGVDTLRNKIYVPAGPPVTGILVFRDPTTPQASLVTNAHATLTGLNGNPAGGTVNFTHTDGAGTQIQAILTNVPNGTTLQLDVTSTVGNEVIPCPSNGSGVAQCSGTRFGAPLLGGVVELTSNGVAIAQGTIRAGALSIGPLGLTITATPNPAAVGGTVTKTLTVTNTSGAAIPGVAVTDTLPANVTFVSATSSVGTCTGTTTVTCAVGTLAAGASATITIQVTPTAAAAGTSLTNSATATGTGVTTPTTQTVTIAVSAAPTTPVVAVAPHLPPLPPLLPPLLPPPPPLLPPPPFAMGGGMMPMPEVPVIPEAETLPLLLGGLAALGALAGWRARRR